MQGCQQGLAANRGWPLSGATARGQLGLRAATPAGSKEESLGQQPCSVPSSPQVLLCPSKL